MKKEQFQKLSEETIQQITRTLEGQTTQDEEFFLNPKTAIRLEQIINLNNDRTKYEGFVLKPIRKPHQKLYKPATKQTKHHTFINEEEKLLKRYEDSLSLATGRLGKGVFQCFLTLSLLQKDPLSIYFLHPPDQLYLKLPDYHKKIYRPLGMVMIANKLLRGEYQNKKEFQFDISTMINNAKVYFQNNEEMFSIATLFEIKFWEIYETEIKKYEQGLLQFRETNKALNKPTYERLKVRRKDYDLEQRKAINRRLKEQTPAIQQKIRVYLAEQCKDSIINGEIKITAITKQQLTKITRMMAPEQPKQVKLSKQDIFEESEEEGHVQRDYVHMNIADEDFEIQSDN